MIYNLITVYPSIVFETIKLDWGQKKDDPDTFDEISYNNTHIFSYKNFIENTSIIDSKYAKHINELHDRIIDTGGNKLDDYAIILDKQIDYSRITIANPDSQHLLSYFFYIQNLDYWVVLDHIKIMCFQGGGRRIFINNSHEHFSPKYLYLLPIEQNHKRKIRLHNNIERLVIEVFNKILDQDSQHYKRLISSITLFNESCRINRFNANSSVVLIVSALESLLDLPRYSKRTSFAYALKLLWGFDKRIEEWALELYGLRSQIVHGDVVEGEKLLASKDRHYSHFSIARDMFHYTLMFILETHGKVSIDNKYKFRAIKSIRKLVISNKEKISTILKQKKKFSFKSFLKNKDLYKQFVLQVEELTMIDYSGENLLPNLFELIKTISIEWIEYDKSKRHDTKDRALKNYIEFRNKKYDKIKLLFIDIEKLKWRTKYLYEISQKIADIKEEVRQLEPVFHEKDKFKFTLQEFLDRCLHSMYIL